MDQSQNLNKPVGHSTFCPLKKCLEPFKRKKEISFFRNALIERGEKKSPIIREEKKMSLQSSCSGDSGRMTMWCYHLLLCSHHPLCVFEVCNLIYMQTATLSIQSCKVVIFDRTVLFCSRPDNCSLRVVQKLDAHSSTNVVNSLSLHHVRLCHSWLVISARVKAFLAHVASSVGFLNFARPDCMCVHPALL